VAAEQVLEQIPDATQFAGLHELISISSAQPSELIKKNIEK
jgi:hypothetical protein